MRLIERIKRLEQHQPDDTWKPGMLPLAGDDYPDFWVPGPGGQRMPVTIDDFI